MPQQLGVTSLNIHIKKIVVIVSVVLFSAGPAFAKKPDSPGNSGKNKSEHHHSHDSSAASESTSHQNYFSDERKSRIRSYYSQSKSSTNCPPGLAKKNNGCQPPGQAKKWRKGQPLPNDVIYYDVPTELIHQLGRTPEGQRIVRVGTDLLLISIGTGMVIDALQDLDDIF